MSNSYTCGTYESYSSRPRDTPKLRSGPCSRAPTRAECMCAPGVPPPRYCPSDCHPGTWAKDIGPSIGGTLDQITLDPLLSPLVGLSAVAPDGSVVLAGSAAGDIDLGGGTLSASQGSGVLAKYDSSGRYLGPFALLRARPLPLDVATASATARRPAHRAPAIVDHAAARATVTNAGTAAGPVAHRAREKIACLAPKRQSSFLATCSEQLPLELDVPCGAGGACRFAPRRPFAKQMIMDAPIAVIQHPVAAHPICDRRWNLAGAFSFPTPSPMPCAWGCSSLALACVTSSCGWAASLFACWV